MAGYLPDYSMSNNAAAAYQIGEAPLSKWTKAALLTAAGEKAEILKPLTAAELRDLMLCRDGWHHTSCRYNRTVFYAVDEDALEEVTPDAVAQIIAARAPKTAKTEKSPAAEPKTITAEVTYTVWIGKYAKYRKPKDVTEIVTYREGDKMIRTSDGNKRLSSMQNVRVIGEAQA